jgi:hypothetical protein
MATITAITARTISIVVPEKNGVDPGPGPRVMVMVTWLVLVNPFRVAFTKRTTTPELDPAVKFTVGPVVGPTLPSSLVRVQEYVVPAGQGPPVHSGVAVKTWVPAMDMLADAGEMLTDAMVGTELDRMVMNTG